MPPLPVRLYAGLAALATPVAYRRIAARLRAQNVPETRIRERLGRASLARPPGRLIWLHGASVGESLSVLPLVERLLAGDTDLHCLITTGTASSASILAGRLPTRCLHQFAPLDSAPALRRFLGHWRPDLAVLVESEIWPQTVIATARSGVPLALINARLSPGSLRNWGRLPASARYLFGLFRLVLTQTAATAEGLRALGAPDVQVAGDMKAAAAPLPHDPATLATLRAALADRPVWVAASTHPSEEEVLLDAHLAARKALPGLLLILVPRHPELGDAIAALIAARGLDMRRRSTGEAPEGDVYLADTLGELGLWYRLAPVAFVGGSLTPVGGHNPYEPAALGVAVLSGPQVANFATAYAALAKAGGNGAVSDAPAIAAAVTRLLSDAAALASAQRAARDFAATGSQTVERTARALLALLPASG